MKAMTHALAGAWAACLLGLSTTAEAAEPSCTHFETPGGGILTYDVFMIFFDADSDTITPGAAAILDHVATVYRPLSHCRLIVAAHTDRAGGEDYNLALSQRRANAVVDDLRRRGVRAIATIEPFGESRPLVETADGVAEPQNRRAEIIIAPRHHP